MISFKPLGPEDVEVRVGMCSEKGCSLLLYKDARVDMRLLDETVSSENWQCDYKTIDGKLYCGIGCRFKDGEWVWKWDTGTPSNMEAQKGEASDAFKRAGFKWGIGRELYTAPFIWIPATKCNIKDGRNGKPQCYDDFRVTEMIVADGQITKLTIVNDSMRGEVVYGTYAKRERVSNGSANGDYSPDNDVIAAAWKRVKSEVWAWCKRNGCATEEEFRNKLNGIQKRPEWPTQKGSLEWLGALADEFRNG